MRNNKPRLWNSHEVIAALTQLYDDTLYASKHKEHRDNLLNNSPLICPGGVVIDSRKVVPGAIFCGLNGNNFNGSDFAIQAFAAGAALCIVENIPEDLPGHLRERCLLVNDGLSALHSLAQHSRGQFTAPVIGVTGSSGKTTVKEMLHLALNAVQSNYSSSGNFNNHIGVPLSLANLSPTASSAVFEMGMSAPGEIYTLSAMVRPEISIITGVHAAHAEKFANISEIAEAKAEIFANTQKIALINNDCSQRDLQIARARAKQLDIVTFGVNPDSDIQLQHFARLSPNSDAMVVEARIFGQNLHYTVGAYGQHLAINSLLVMAIASLLKLDLAKVAASLQDFRALTGRGRLYNLTDRNILIIDDTYNANLGSINASLAHLASYKQRGRRTWAILGDMKELGQHSAKLHAEIAGLLARHNIEQFVAFGEMMQYAMENLGKTTNLALYEAGNIDNVINFLENTIQNGDVLLIKGANSMQMERIVQALAQGCL